MAHKKTEYAESPILNVDSKKMMLYLTLIGLTTLFMGLTVAYMLSKPNWHWSQFSFPKAFLASSLFLLLSSYTMQQTLVAFKNDNLKRLKQLLFASLFLSFAFLVGQFFGWQSLQNKGIYFSGKPDGSYLYLISGLHALHLVVGLIFLLYQFVFVHAKVKDEVQALLFFTNEKAEKTLELLIIYWHFVDILWLYLLVFFILNHL
ncbi:MAG: cytochrome c oxidase subunit 3 [Chitinophagales bacterium]